MGAHHSSPMPGLPLAIQTTLVQNQTQQMPSTARHTADRQSTDSIFKEKLVKNVLQADGSKVIIIISVTDEHHNV